MSYAHTNTPEEERAEYITPDYVLGYARLSWVPRERASNRTGQHVFDVDLAANDNNFRCEEYLSPEQNALTVDWHSYGKFGWLNPPYDDLAPWYTKAAVEANKGFRTVMLVPTLNGASHDEIVLREATELRFIIGRISFIRPSGEVAPSNNRGSMFAIFGPMQDKELLLPNGPAISYVNRRLMIRAYSRKKGRLT